MSLFRSLPTLGAERPSVLVALRLIDKQGLPLDASVAWQAILLAFRDHPHFAVKQALIGPDKDYETEA